MNKLANWATVFTMLALVLTAPLTLSAETVATINGVYDVNGHASDFVPAGYSYATNGVVVYQPYLGASSADWDTPSLFIINSSGAAMTGVSLTAYAYQIGSTNYGDAAIKFLPDIAANTVYQYVFNDTPGYAACGPYPDVLFSYDYDDSLGCSASDRPGNTEITFRATLASGPFAGPIHSIFSPTTNFTGSFVGYEGLDENGYAESGWDAHSSTPGGTLAEITTGAVPTPEPSSLALVGAGLLGLAFARRKNQK